MPVRLSESAVKRITEVLALKNKFALRIAIIGGKCSGFSYQYTLADSKNDDDTLIEHGQARLIIDSVSLPLLEGSEVDFIDDLMGQAFKIHNPNAISSCGCGMSFSV